MVSAKPSMPSLSTRPPVELKSRNQPRSISTTRAPQELLDRLKAQLIPWAKPLLEPARYKGLWGGRGSGKSVAATDALLITGLERCCRILCAREFQNSLSDSVHQLLCDRISALGLEDYYTIQEAKIFAESTGTELFFRGLRRNVRSLKSIPGITHVWIEEASSTSAQSWNILVPTIRDPGSEIWVTFNPDQRTDPIYQHFVESPDSLAGHTYIQEVNWRDNPYFPPELEAERRAMLATDPDLYQHVYEGQCWERSEAQVLVDKWVVDDFTPGPDWDGPYHGADWGFAVDPTTLVRCWVYANRLYIEYESSAVRLELRDTPARWRADVPGCEGYTIRADSARPESISEVKRHGMPGLVAVDKWPGSVEDGIAHLRSYDKIVIHSRCKAAAEEARLWRYRTDPLTGDVLPSLLPGNDHVWDGCRYALNPLIKRRRKPRRPRQFTTRNW